MGDYTLEQGLEVRERMDLRAILAAGVVGAGAYDRAHAELKAFTADPTTLVSAPRVVHAWGTRPKL